MSGYTYYPDIVARTKIQGHNFINFSFTVKFLYPAIYMNALVTMVPIVIYKGNWDIIKTCLLLLAVFVPVISAVMGTYGGVLKNFFKIFHGPIAYVSLIPFGYYGSLTLFDLLIIMVSVIWGIIYWCIMGAGLGDPLKRMLEVLDKIKNGDLRSRIILNFDRNDEIGKVVQGINSVLDLLNDVIGNINKNIEIILDSASRLNNQAKQTSAGTVEVASAIGEVAGTADQVSLNSQKVAERALHTLTVAAGGKQSIASVTEQMNSIKRTSSEVSGVISDLAKRSNTINQIVEVITGIAEQTNLLALNAAIEAARAGDQGRGFAVVAEEVRKLAEQSGSAAGEIRNLITDIQNTSIRAVEAMEAGARDVEAGSLIVAESGENFERIMATVEDLSTQVQDMAAASEQISSAMQNVAASTEEQTAAVEEVNSTVETLFRMAGELKALSHRFTV